MLRNISCYNKHIPKYQCLITVEFYFSQQSSIWFAAQHTLGDGPETLASFLCYRGYLTFLPMQWKEKENLKEAHPLFKVIAQNGTHHLCPYFIDKTGHMATYRGKWLGDAALAGKSLPCNNTGHWKREPQFGV